MAVYQADRYRGLALLVRSYRDLVCSATDQGRIQRVSAGFYPNKKPLQ